MSSSSQYPSGGRGTSSDMLSDTSSSILSIHLDRLDVLAPLPKPKFAGATIDSVMVSVAGNLYQSEAPIYITFFLNEASQVVESPMKNLAAKQQHVDFKVDLSVDIQQEFLVKRQDSENVICAPLTVQLNRKGLIESEIVAVGTALIPVGSKSLPTLVENFAVALFSVEEKEEIAIVRMSAQALMEDTPVLVRLMTELQNLVEEHVISNTKAMSLKGGGGGGGIVGGVTSAVEWCEVFQRWVCVCGPIRKFWMTMRDIFLWRSLVRSWLFILFISLQHHGIIIAICSVVGLSIDAFEKSPLIVAAASSASASSSPPKESTDANIAFMQEAFSVLSDLCEILSATRPRYVIGSVAVIFFIPNVLYWACLIGMVWNTYWASALFSILWGRAASLRLPNRVGNRKGSIDSVNGNSSGGDSSPLGDSGMYSTYENQRWWVGKWTNKLLAIERPNWSDEAGSVKTPKESYCLPHATGLGGPGEWKWTSLWMVAKKDSAGMETDSDGWTYARDFKSSHFHPSRGIGDFVRRRKWIRTFQFFPAVPSPAPATSSTPTGAIKLGE